MVRNRPNLSGMPHNICDSLPDRCVAEVMAFLQRRFGA
jgi:hypothetical protein